MPPKRQRRSQAEHEARASGQHQATRPRLNTLASPSPPPVPRHPQQANGPQGIAAEGVQGPPQPGHLSPLVPPSGHPVIPSYASPNSPQQATPQQAYSGLLGRVHPAAWAIMGNRPQNAVDTQTEAQRLSDYAVRMRQHQVAQRQRHQAARPSNHNPHMAIPPTNSSLPQGVQGSQGPFTMHVGHIYAHLSNIRTGCSGTGVPCPAPTTSASGAPYDENLFRQLHENLRNIREAELVTVRIAS